MPAGATKALQSSGITLVYVSAGEFWMGSADTDTEADSDEKPQHKVYLDGYWIGQTEVTNAQYRKFLDAGGYGNRQYWSEAGWLWKEGSSITEPIYWDRTEWNGDEYPVVGVTWYEAEAYARWAGVRLPSEAEWEYAARGGLSSRGYLYAGSHDVEEVAWYGSNSGGRTHPVVQKKGNELGLYDMSGNAWEWVADWYDSGYYGRSPAQNPTGPSTGDYRVLRGGSWYLDPSSVRCASRGGGSPDSRLYSLGFRVAQ